MPQLPPWPQGEYLRRHLDAQHATRQRLLLAYLSHGRLACGGPPALAEALAVADVGIFGLIAEHLGAYAARFRGSPTAHFLGDRDSGSRTRYQADGCVPLDLDLPLKWNGAAAAARPGGCVVYCPPFTASHGLFEAAAGGGGGPAGWSSVLAFDPATGKAECIHGDLIAKTQKPGSDVYLYQGAVTGSDGRVYCVPVDASGVLVIDPATGGAEILHEDICAGDRSKEKRWAMAALDAEGRMYCAPLDADGVLVIDTLRNEAEIKYTGLGAGGYKCDRRPLPPSIFALF